MVWCVIFIKLDGKNIIPSFSQSPEEGSNILFDHKEYNDSILGDMGQHLHEEEIESRILSFSQYLSSQESEP